MKEFDLLSIREYFPSKENPVATIWVYEQLKELQQYGINSLVISPTPIVPKILKYFAKKRVNWKIKHSKTIENYNGVNVIRPPYLKLPTSYFSDYNIKFKTTCINNTSKNFKFKLIHAHFGQDGICSIPIKLKKNVPLITSFYGCDLGSEKDRLRKYYKKLSIVGDLFLALSENMANDLQDLNFPADKIIVHHLGIDVDKFIPKMKSKKEKFIFTVVANFFEIKGIHYVIEAFKEFIKNKDVKDYELRLVGNGPYIKELERLAFGYKNIIFVNNFMTENPRETVLSEMQLADVFLLTSISLPNGDKEGTPVVLMESQACGKPCIATKHAGIPELIVDNVTGILIEEKNVNQIIEAMELLSQNNKLREMMGLAARDYVIQNFNNKIQIENLNSIYRRFI